MHFGDQNALCSETNHVREKNLKKKIQYKSNQNKTKIEKTIGGPTYLNTTQHTTLPRFSFIQCLVTSNIQ